MGITTEDEAAATCERCGRFIRRWPDGTWLDEGLSKYCYGVDEPGANLIQHRPISREASGGN